MPEYEPYELSYYQECDKNEALERKIFHLEEENQCLQEEIEIWKNLFAKQLPEEKLNDKEWLICAISRLQYLLDEIEELK